MCTPVNLYLAHANDGADDVCDKPQLTIPRVCDDCTRGGGGVCAMHVTQGGKEQKKDQ